ncbi:MAG: glycosyltransferase family 4 protein [Kofleriaceae bacterium]
MQLRHVVRALTPMHNVDLLVVREGDQGYVERQGSVRILRVPAPETDLRMQIQSFQRALRRQLEGADYDVVHCRDAWSGLTVLELRERLGYAVVYDLTRAPGESVLDPELDAQYGRDEEACLLAADIVLAPTPAAAKALQHRGKPERVFLSPPGVDVDRFDWDDPPTGGLPRIVYAGSIDAGRGVRVLIRAMAAIVREVDARLVLAGPMVSPRFEQALEDGIRELGLTDKVDLVGIVDHDQIPALLATASVCVVPAAADLTPNPTVVFPTKLLEYMACRRPIVAPRRETVQQVVENGREALLFEPGDPVDLARKVLRILGEPLLGQRIAAEAYERVRRDFTASAARRALQKAYTVIAQRFDQAIDDDDDAPKVEMLSDDDFEATVFEEAPIAPAVVDTALTRIGDPNADSLSDPSSSENVAAPPRPSPSGPSGPSGLSGLSGLSDDTLDRHPVAPPRVDEPGLSRQGSAAEWQRGVVDTSVWTVSALVAAPAPRSVDDDARSGIEIMSPPTHDDWVVTNVAGVVREINDDLDTGAVARATIRIPAESEEGTPADGTANPTPSSPLPVSEDNVFVAGEIDVPTPPPEKRITEPQASVEAHEFIAASSLLGNADSSDPDTGSRTPPLERRNP